MISDILRGSAVIVVWSPPSHLRLRAIMFVVICSFKSGTRVVCSISLALTTLLCCLPFSHLCQGRMEAAEVALRAHPTLGTIDPLQIVGDELEELVDSARRASDPQLAMQSHDISHPPDTSVCDADAITDLE
jgi:hypothetical protein